MAGARSLARPRSSGCDISLLRLGDPRERRVDRGGRLAHAGQDVAREGARRRERAVERGERGVGVLERRREQADRACCRLPSSLANAAIVVLKFVIRSLSWPSLRISAPVVFAVPASSRATSRSGSVPSSASLTWAVPLSAPGESL